MRRACLRLRAKVIRYSCQTAFAVERDILARVVCVCVCVFINLNITAQFGPGTLVVLCH